jgi:superfamily II DNA or RNA helicase
MLMFDEVHHGSADTWQEVGKKSKTVYRVGLSGTPLKNDELSDMLMMSLVGPVVFDLNAPWLQEQGYLAQARLEIKKLDFTSPINRTMKWQEARKKLLVENHERTVHIANDIAVAIRDEDVRLLVLTGNSVDLAESLAEEVEALVRPLTRKLRREPFTLITGKMSPKKVSKAFSDLRKGKVRCVITTKLADEGIDVPDINLLYLVGGGKAYVSTVQRIGRGLRVKDDGAELLVVDYFTEGNKYLEKHDRQRLKTYEGEDFFREVVIQDAP